MNTEYSKYLCTIDNVSETLDNYGVAIVENVLNPEECEQMSSEMWDFFEHISSEWKQPICRRRKNTWKSIYDLKPLHGQLFQHWSVGHCQASWNIRQNPKVVDIFAKIWNTSPWNLLSSYDGLSMCLPPEITNKGWQRKTWFHCDQSFLRNDK